MGAEVYSDFEAWLCQKLTSLDIDNDVFGAYIIGIMSEEDDAEERRDALQQILESIVEESGSLCDDIMRSWNEMQKETCASLNQDEKHKDNSSDISNLLASHLGINAITKKPGNLDRKTTESSEEMRSIKQSVIAMYSSLSDTNLHDDNEDGLSDNDPTAPSNESNAVGGTGLFKNTNAQTVENCEKMERAKRKDDAMKKKEKDKMDLELQKVKKVERKEKEKKRTQKKDRNR